jgi:hypothetical protein
MASNLTNIVTANIAMWVTKVLDQLDPQGQDLVTATVEDPEADLRVVVEFKRGRIALEATRGTQKFELYAEEVEPLRPRTGFGEPESQGGH